MAKEIELKCRLHDSQIEALSEWLNNHADPLTTLTLRNDYFDTANLALSVAKAALRIRSHGDALEQDTFEQNTFEQTLKTRGHSQGGMHVRNEWNWPLASKQLDIDLLHSPEVAATWPSAVNVEDLDIIFGTHFTRQRWHWRSDDALTCIEVVIDQGQIVVDDKISGAPRAQALCEIELELIEGESAKLWLLLLQLHQHAALWLSDVSKAERGYRLFLGEVHQEENLPSIKEKSVLDWIYQQLAQLQRAIEQTVWQQDSMAYRALWNIGYPLWTVSCNLVIERSSQTLASQELSSSVEDLLTLLADAHSQSDSLCQHSESLCTDRAVALALTELSLAVFVLQHSEFTMASPASEDWQAIALKARRQVIDVLEYSPVSLFKE
ncbi:MAG: CYTH domain-containing protein [Oleibacter sp.]|nr:CYTH domain-containing protein [Thalassolituus sp.]